MGKKPRIRLVSLLQTIIEKDKGHLNEEFKVFKLPSALNAVLEVAKLYRKGIPQKFEKV